MSKIFNINLDVRKNNYICLSGFKQGDNLSTIYGCMLQNSVAYDLTNLTLRANFKDSQGNLYFQDSSKGVSIINPTEGTFKIDVLSSVLSVEGIIKADISIFKATQKLTSSTFSMEVVETIYKDGAIIGVDGKDLLQAIVEGETDRVNAEKIRKTNEVDRVEKEVDRKAKEVIREDNESKRKQGYSKMDSRIDNLVLGQGNITEVVDAHLDSVSNVKYPTLKARLDHTSKQLFDSSLTTLTTSNYITPLNNATDGLMQIDSIRGRTLQNIMQNGDFSKGTINWVGESGSTLSVNGNVGIATGNGSTKHLGIAQFLNPSFFVPTHKIYSRMMVRTTDAGVDVKPEILLQIKDASVVTVDKISNASQNTWYTLSGITPIIGSELPYIRAIVFYSTAEQQRNRVLEMKEVMILDLTQMFGMGNEPTKEWCDANLSFFDGIKSTGEEFSDVNLFDKSKATLNAVVNNKGEVVSSPDYYCSDFISVKENYKVRFKDSSKDGSAGLAFYKDRNFVSWISNADLYKMGLIVTIPIGINFLRASSYRTPITIDNYTINQEEYKIEPLSQGKNLFDKSKIIKGIFQIASTGGTSANDLGWVSKDYIHVKQNTDYTIAKGIGSGIYGYCFYDSSKTYISGVIATSGVTNPQKITTPPNTAYIKLSGRIEALDTQQFEKGGISTQYEQPKSDKLEITLDSPLCGLPNGVSDEIIGDRVHRRIGKTILNGNGNENWVEYKGEPSQLFYKAYVTNISPIAKTPSTLICDNFMSTSAIWLKESEGITSHSSLKYLYINILKSKLTTPDLVGLRKWLSENNTTIYYELADPIISSVNPSSLKNFKDGSIILNNVITPTIDLRYPTSIGGRLVSVENTLDSTVDRIRKLEEALFVVTAELLEARKKMVYIGYATLDYFNGASGKTKAYKNMQIINVQLEINFQEEPSQNRLHYATVQEGFRPISNIMNEITDATGSIVGILEVETDGKFYIRKKGSLSSKFFRGNITYMTAE